MFCRPFEKHPVNSALSGETFCANRLRVLSRNQKSYAARRGNKLPDSDLFGCYADRAIKVVQLIPATKLD